MNFKLKGRMGSLHSHRTLEFYESMRHDLAISTLSTLNCLEPLAELIREGTSY